MLGPREKLRMFDVRFLYRVYRNGLKYRIDDVELQSRRFFRQGQETSGDTSSAYIRRACQNDVDVRRGCTLHMTWREASIMAKHQKLAHLPEGARPAPRTPHPSGRAQTFPTLAADSDPHVTRQAPEAASI